ncbi:hypothetical protein EDC01DRAFT_609846 [Geopyxis carbonaria]|nr:hypothetical protein EDC01DRAFT_609846 [Geopyxis carbonaria]
MSGFEIVGVTLGAIPVLISALEHYSKGVRTIENMAKYETVYENLLISFGTGLSIYRSSCETLLGPLELPEAQLRNLLEEPEGVAWEDEELSERIRERLGISYKPYKSAVQHLDRKIKIFSKKLKLKDDMNPPWVLPNGHVDKIARKKFFTSFWMRFMGGFKSENHTTLLNEVLNDINQIHKLTKVAIKLEPLRQDRRRRANTQYWVNIREKAERVFENLNSRWSRGCGCQLAHQVSLRLDIIAVKETETADPATRRFCFKFSFNEKLGAALAKAPWTWLDVDILPWEIPEAKTPPSIASTKKTRFSIPSINIRSKSCSDITNNIPSGKKIDDLCSALSREIQQGLPCAVGYLDDGLWQHFVYYTPSPTHPNYTDTLSNLAYSSMLSTQQKSVVLNLYHRCTLALTLASAVFQLYNSHWLDERWSMKDIFITADNKSYITKTFPDTSHDRSATSSQNTTSSIKNKTAFCLGVFMLELSYGQSIRSLATTQELGPDGNATYFTEYETAQRLIDEIAQRELQNYADATIRCVRCNFDTPRLSFDNADFRELFYKGVILPLQRDHEYIHKKASRI